MKKAIIVSEGGGNNLGDNAILYSIMNILKKKDIEFDCWNYSKVYSINIEKVFKSYSNSITKSNNKKVSYLSLFKKIIPNKFKWYLKNFRNFKQLKNYRFAIIGGGQLINGGNFTYSLYYWSKYFKKHNIPYYIMNVGCGSDITVYDYKDLKVAFQNSAGIYMRDQISLNMLKTITNKELSIIPDVAYLISDFNTKYSIKYNDSVTIFVASYKDVVQNLSEKYFLNIEAYFDYIISSIININDFNSINITYSDIEQDKNDAFEFFNYINIKYNFLNKTNFITINSLNNMVEEIISTKLIVSSRLHPLIIAKSYNKDLIPIEISNKIISFKNQLLSDSINDIKININDIYNKILSKELNND